MSQQHYFRPLPESETIQIEVRQDTAQLLAEKAAARKLSLDEYLRVMAESDVPPKMKTFDEILAPFRAEVEAKGYSEDDLEELFTEARRTKHKQEPEA